MSGKNIKYVTVTMIADYRIEVPEGTINPELYARNLAGSQIKAGPSNCLVSAGSCDEYIDLTAPEYVEPGYTMFPCEKVVKGWDKTKINMVRAEWRTEDVTDTIDKEKYEEDYR